MLLCTYPLLRQRPLRVPALRRATLKSAKWPNAFCPNPSVPRCGSACPHHWPCSVGPPRSAIPGRVAANPASCRVTHCAKPAFGQRGLTGPLRSRSRARAKARSRSKDREASSLLQLNTAKLAQVRRVQVLLDQISQALDVALAQGVVVDVLHVLQPGPAQ